MKLRLLAFSVRTCLSVIALTAISSAQSSLSDKASAEVLFNEGRILVTGGSYAEGCSKFEGSRELEATLGTSLHLADCYERLGKTASAWALFKEGQHMARRQADSEREEVARQRAEQLMPKLSYLTLDIQGRRPAGLSIRRNGTDLPLASLGVPLPVDPGTQHVTASAPSFRAWTGRVEVGDGASPVQLLVPQLVALPRAPAVGSPSRPPPSQPAASAQRTWGILASGVGLATVLGGAGLGFWAKREYDRSRLDLYCPSDDHNGCTSEGLALRQRAQGFANASTITLIAGGAVLTTGIVLWSTASSERPRFATRARIGAAATPTSFRTVLEGAW